MMSYEEFKKLVYDQCLNSRDGSLSGFPEKDVKEWLGRPEQEAMIKEGYEDSTDSVRYTEAVKRKLDRAEWAEELERYRNGTRLHSCASSLAYAFSLMY